MRDKMLKKLFKEMAWSATNNFMGEEEYLEDILIAEFGNNIILDMYDETITDKRLSKVYEFAKKYFDLDTNDIY